MKKNRKAKKLVKKVKKTTRKTSTELVIKVQPVPAMPTSSDLAEPVKDGGKYMIPKTWVSERQVLRLVQKTPPQHIYSRPAKGGGRWAYVTGNYVEKVLNFTFGWNWDFEVVSHGREEDMVWVLGKLTVKDDKGHMITKTQFGRADIKFKKDSRKMLDYGNDLKAATTDALKKCASLLGIASDVYGKTEYKQETGVDTADSYDMPAAVNEAQAKSGEENQEIVDYVCSKCGNDISKAEGEYSKKVFGKMLCRKDQGEAKAK